MLWELVASGEAMGEYIQKNCSKGFSLIELLAVILLVGILGTIIIVKYNAMSKSAEEESVVSMLGTLSAALDIYSTGQIVNSQTLTIHNPFDDLSVKPPNYAGAFGDVTDLNCPAGNWAYQSGNGSNGNWTVLVYRPNATLSQAFVWNNIQWIIFVINVNTDANGYPIGFSMTYYPPAPIW